ncbi:Nrap protein [Exophiala viscosa]|uniref:U3 small nucleolar RNA-associated protein 22 n=1 Tax=Exophiala viscosa TaxID=2486360 RepID=A0AAN6DL98_9EURO|nr:Nrap protein [Exophiala viscosa]
MSIKGNQAQKHSSKRRKLSHSASEDEADVSSPRRNNKTAQATNDTTVNETSRQENEARDSGNTRGTTLPTGGVTKSSMLALQVADLNTELTPNYEKLQKKWAAITKRLRTLIEQIPDRAPVTAIDALKHFRKHGVEIPFPKPQPTKDTNYKLAFKAPQEVVTDGALPLNLSIKGDHVIRMTVIMPAEVLQEKDYLNNRSFHKAACYLACIATALKENAAADFESHFAHLHDVDLLPILEVVPTDKSLSKFTFQIGIGFPHESIPIAKTLPIKNCFRRTLSGEVANHEEPTPFYNSAIRYAASTAAFEKLVKAAGSPNFQEVCRVGLQWLRQRGFSSAMQSGGFGFLEWSLMCALLLQGGGHRGQPLFSKQYSSLQLFKAILQILAGRDLRDPWVLNGTAVEIPRSEEPVLFDAKTGVNILYKMTPWSYQALRHHAQVSLALVNARRENSFDETFVLNVATPVLQYDEVFSVTIPGDAFNTASEQRQYLSKMHNIFSRGLGDRASLVDFKLPQGKSWSLDQDSTVSDGNFQLEVALLANPETVTRLVDHGPSADEQDEAAEYRKFWGEKAELRRFKDGSISESLVWASGSLVTLQILAHLGMLHFKLLLSAIKVTTRDLESSSLADDAGIVAKDAFRVISTTFQTLTSKLHNLEGLPLPIRSITPADPALRSSSVGNPLLPSTANPIDIIIEFDSSTRWPDSLPAIQHTKIAFLLKVGELLTASDSSINTRVGLENTASATTGHFNTTFLDIIYPSSGAGLAPICFRTRIHHDREGHLLQSALADKALHGSVRDSLSTALATYKRDFGAKPVHTTTVRSLCSRFLPLSSTIRLLKKWVASHLLLEHVPEEILEIVAASVFLRPAPWSVPGSSTTAFLRCLHLLARWDWATSPLIVDLSLSQDMTAEQVSEVQTRFQAWRKLDPSMNNVVWFVGTSLDTTGTVWTQGARPPRVVAGRLSALARAAMGVIENQKTGMRQSDWDGLFTSPLSDFDFLIHVKPSVIRGRKQKARGKGGADFKNLQIHEALDVESIGYDPVALFLQDLTQALGSSALFFHDRYGGRVVAGLWKPSVLGRKEWRVRLGWSSVPVPAEENEKEGGKDMCAFNKNGVLAEIAMLGDGLVESITIKE